MPKRAIGGGTDIIYDDCEGKQISFAEAIYNALYSSVNVSTWLPLPSTHVRGILEQADIIGRGNL